MKFIEFSSQFLGCVVDNHPESKSPVKNVTLMSLANAMNECRTPVRGTVMKDN